jgi:hypothetical protein
MNDRKIREMDIGNNKHETYHNCENFSEKSGN